MANFLFLSSLVPTARECLLSLRSVQLAPAMYCTIGNAQITGDLRYRLFTTFCKLYGFHFKFTRECWLRLLHGIYPSPKDLVPQVYLLHFTGSSPDHHR